MTQLSKERLVEIRDYDTCVTLDESAEMARRLLAAEAQEPVAYIGKQMLESLCDEGGRSCGRVWRSNTDEMSGESRIPLFVAPQPVAVPDEWRIMCGDWRDETAAIHGGSGLIVSGINPEAAGLIVDAHNACRTAPQPVAAPDESYQNLSEIYHAQEARLFKLAQRIKGPEFDKYAYPTSRAIDVIESALFGEEEDACRDAMLKQPSTIQTNNGACSGGEIKQPASKSLQVPEGWIPCSERMPEREYVLAADFSGAYYLPSLPNTQVGIYADWFEDGNPSWDDGDGNDLHLKQVTHWMPLPAARQQESDNWIAFDDTTAQQYQSLATNSGKRG